MSSTQGVPWWNTELWFVEKGSSLVIALLFLFWSFEPVVGTEDDIKEPTATFSSCFGAAFIMLHPTQYAAMLAEKMKKHGATGGLVNTGWSGGRLLDASLSASGSPSRSLKMALILSQVGLTCKAKLHDERFLWPGGLNAETVTFFYVILANQLPNVACQSILFKLIIAILRHETSETLRRCSPVFISSQVIG